MDLKRTIFVFPLLIFSSLVIAQPQKREDGFKIGGSMRYNILSTNYESGGSKLNPDATWDTWRLNVDGSMSGIDLSFEYRFYPTFDTHFIHHGYIGYAFSDKVYMKLGVSQVPFGIPGFASHSWWFQIPYYLGLEDDYDMGISFDLKPAQNLDLSLAYFRQAEPQGPGIDPFAGRYSYDIVPGTGAFVNDEGELIYGEEAIASLRELNQFNARLVWHFTDNWQVGLSAQSGGIYNSVLDETDLSTAFAAHLAGDFGRFNLKAEVIRYDYNAKGDNGRDLDVVQMGGYGYAYVGGDRYTGGVASKANIYVAGLAYTIPVEWGALSSIQPYIDYSMVDKDVDIFHDTHHLVLGMMITAGPVYTYIDYALGKNQPWLTDDFGKGLGSGVEDARWNSRFNANIGYYF
ncbi:MAG: hypothetical protein WC126_05870 [Proteiniphilum sp.]|jgi:hypothetical protein